MSKRLGNAVDPFETIEQYSADASRWYMISNAAPWDNLKFNEEGLAEVRRKFFGTLYNTYSFFALYANIDGFAYKEAELPIGKRPEIDRWILSLLNSLIQEVDEYYAEFEPTKAARAIQNFVDEHLSNWYVRLCRRRFWKGEYSEDKISAYQTLYSCLVTVAKLMSPIAPFYSDRLYLDLDGVTGLEGAESVHLVDFPACRTEHIDLELEQRMALAQDVSSLVLSLRKKSSLNVRQPLQKILIPVLDDNFAEQLHRVEDLIKSETNIKEIELINDASGIIRKKVRPNFKALGPKVGKDMKVVSQEIQGMDQDAISQLEQQGFMQLENSGHMINLSDVEILAEDVEGWQVASLGRLTVALDVQVTPALRAEGIARELVNRIQNLRKDKGLEVTDRIRVRMLADTEIAEACQSNASYIQAEILAESLIIDEHNSDNDRPINTHADTPVDGEVIEIGEKKLVINIDKIEGNG